jgi:uncharacterized protein (DUF2062 family)
MELIPSRKIQQRFTVGTTRCWHRDDTLEANMSQWLTNRKSQATGWLQTGISPQQLALTLALGFAIGCLPVFGIPTALCAVVAIALKLNVPAIQAANYLAMPVQLALMVPFVRLGGRMFSSGQRYTFGGMAMHTLAAWLVIAGPMVLLLTLALTPVLQRVPVFAGERGE